jgi:hypothetical protein
MVVALVLAACAQTQSKQGAAPPVNLSGYSNAFKE